MAHPDDIEFNFAGTLLLLGKVGCKIHMWNLADGCCGSLELKRETIAFIRAEESRASADLAGARLHPPLFHDLEIFHDLESLRSVSATVRAVRPQIILTHAPSDYMEDHQNVSRLVTGAAFSRAMPNFESRPPTPAYADPVRIYHAPPHGLKDGLETPFRPGFLVETTPVMETKRRMLACHRSQQEWLDQTQGMPAYLQEMERMSEQIASLGQGLRHAEAWRRHSHLGFCPPEFDPLSEILSSFIHQPTS